jgi:hypothetical protein
MLKEKARLIGGPAAGQDIEVSVGLQEIYIPLLPEGGAVFVAEDDEIPRLDFDVALYERMKGTTPISGRVPFVYKGD